MRLLRQKGLILILFIVTLLSGCSMKTAGHYYKNGIESFNNKNYEEAEDYFKKALELNENRAEYYINYGLTLTMLGEYDNALNYFDRAIFDKSNRIVKQNNKMALRGKGIAYFMSHDYPSAIDEFNKALVIDELDQLNLDILYYKALAESKSGLYDKAVSSYSQILVSKPKDAYIYNERAFAYGKLGEYDKSVADYDKAIELENRNFNFYFSKYFLLLEKGDKVAALDVLDRAAHIEIKTEEDKFNLAKIYYYKEEYSNATISLNEAFRNGFADAYYYLGNIYEKQGDYESALDNYRLFIEDESSDKTASVYNQIALCYINLNQYEEALSYIKTGLSYNDIFVDQALKRNLIVVNEKLGSYDEAYKLIREYTKLYPDDKEAIEELEFIKTRVKQP